MTQHTGDVSENREDGHALDYIDFSGETGATVKSVQGCEGQVTVEHTQFCNIKLERPP